MLINAIVWNVDPELFSLGPLHVRWYGLLWAAGIWITLLVTQRIFKKEKLPEEWLDKLFMYTVIGTIVGARLGHCLFYGWDHYSANPIEILYIWQGGLASHGGAIGIAAAIFLYNKNVSKKGYIWVMDRLLIGVTLCAASIRLGNLMNSEIYGEVTTLPWGFYFPRDSQWDGAAHHPTQIYEMLAYISVFVLTSWLYWKKDASKKPGLIFGTFLVSMFGARFTLEFIKLNQEAFESGMLLNMGQILSIPFIVWGVWLIYNSQKVVKA
jgi:phosphatidylglycerol---prolipoprotein diacylglyceryl transferase